MAKYTEKVPTIDWSGNNGELIWKLITELEKPENFKVFLGKKDKHENTSGDSKAKVAKRMGESILPEFSQMNAKVVAERVQNKLDTLIREYQKHARRIQKTGEGVNDTDNNHEPGFFIEGTGPDELTPPHAQNIWDEIVGAWPYFPRFHALYGSRPNVTPIAVTTGVGPNGPRTQWIQRPDDYIHPDLLAISNSSSTPPTASQQGLSASHSFGSDQTNLYEPTTPPPPALQPPVSSQPSVSAGPTPRPPRPSTASRQIISKTKGIQMVSKKRTLADSILEISKENLEFLRAETIQKRADARRAQLFAEFQAGVWSPEKFREKVEELSNPPAKRLRESSPQRELSPDWPETLTFGDPGDI